MDELPLGEILHNTLEAIEKLKSCLLQLGDFFKKRPRGSVPQSIANTQSDTYRDMQEETRGTANGLKELKSLMDISVGYFEVMQEYSDPDILRSSDARRKYRQTSHETVYESKDSGIDSVASILSANLDGYELEYERFNEHQVRMQQNYAFLKRELRSIDLMQKLRQDIPELNDVGKEMAGNVDKIIKRLLDIPYESYEILINILKETGVHSYIATRLERCTILKGEPQEQFPAPISFALVFEILTPYLEDRDLVIAILDTLFEAGVFSRREHDSVIEKATNEQLEILKSLLQEKWSGKAFDSVLLALATNDYEFIVKEVMDCLMRSKVHAESDDKKNIHMLKLGRGTIFPNPTAADPAMRCLVLTLQVDDRLKQKFQESDVSLEAVETEIIDSLNERLQSSENSEEFGHSVVKAEKGSIIVYLKPQTKNAREELRKACANQELNKFVMSLFDGQQKLRKLFLRGQPLDFRIAIYDNSDLAAQVGVQPDVFHNPFMEHYKYLSKKLCACDFLPNFVRSDILTAEDVAEIEKKHPRETRTRFFLDMVTHTGWKGFEVVLKTLRDKNEERILSRLPVECLFHETCSLVEEECPNSVMLTPFFVGEFKLVLADPDDSVAVCRRESFYSRAQATEAECTSEYYDCVLVHVTSDAEWTVRLSNNLLTKFNVKCQSYNCDQDLMNSVENHKRDSMNILFAISKDFLHRHSQLLERVDCSNTVALLLPGCDMPTLAKVHTIIDTNSPSEGWLERLKDSILNTTPASCDECGILSDIDVFFVHRNSEPDNALVHNIMTELQSRNAPLKCASAQRNFTLNRSITDNYMEYVHRSRNIVIVFSKDFESSTWCNYDAKMAFYYHIQNSHPNVIPLLHRGGTLPDYMIGLIDLDVTEDQTLWLPKLEKAIRSAGACIVEDISRVALRSEFAAKNNDRDSGCGSVHDSGRFSLEDTDISPE